MDFRGIGNALEGVFRLLGCLMVVCPIAIVAAVVFFLLWWFR